MKAIILTGYRHGLGGAIRQLLLDKYRHCSLIFIGRGGSDLLSSLEIYQDLDLENTDYESFAFLDKLLIDVDEVIFINNAGIIQPISGLQSVDVEYIKKNMSINYFSPVFLLTKLVQLCKKIKVLNISSGAAIKPIPYWSAYCSSKSAIRSFLDVIALEGVKVIHIDPGVMDTNMQKLIRTSSNNYPELKQFNELHENGELRTPLDVAKEVCRLI